MKKIILVLAFCLVALFGYTYFFAGDTYSLETHPTVELSSGFKVTQVVLRRTMDKSREKSLLITYKMIETPPEQQQKTIAAELTRRFYTQAEKIKARHIDVVPLKRGEDGKDDFAGGFLRISLEEGQTWEQTVQN